MTIDPLHSQRARACVNPRCSNGMVRDSAAWSGHRGLIHRTCLACSGTPTYVYVVRKDYVVPKSAI